MNRPTAFSVFAVIAGECSRYSRSFAIPSNTRPKDNPSSKRGNAPAWTSTGARGCYLSGRCGRRTARSGLAGQHALLDHVVRSQQHCRRDCEAQRLGSLEVNHQLELRGLLDRQVAGLGTS